MTLPPSPVLAALLVAATGCATPSLLGRGDEQSECHAPGHIDLRQRVSSSLGWKHSCRSKRDTWFDEYTISVHREQGAQFLISSPEEVSLTLIDPDGTPVDQETTSGGRASRDFESFSERLKPGTWTLQVATVSTSTDVAPYTLTVFDGEPHLEGSCWLPDAQPMKLDREEQLSQDDATCALDTGEPSVLRTFVLRDLRDVEIEASEGAKLRILNDQGTTVVWADSKPLMPARYSSTLVPGTYSFLVGLADGRTRLSLRSFPSLVSTPPVPDYEAEQRPGCKDPEKRTRVELGRTYFGRIDDESCHIVMEPLDFDSYTLEIPKDGDYGLSVKAPAYSPYLILIDYRGETVGSSGMTREGDSLFAGHLDAGTYELRVSQSRGAQRGSYELRVHAAE